ncbi:MAG: hypothetical protein K2L96_06485 [Muribaculaceae bacterium]|nr:hypothetical protein [Muribaculaceae bacterium]
MKYADLTRYIHTKGFAVLMLTLAFGGMLAAHGLHEYPALTGDAGFILPSAAEWVAPGWPNFVFALAGNCLLVLAAALTSRFFNVLRSQTALPMALFAAFQLATPGLSGQVYTGLLLAVVVAGCMMLLFSCYRSAVRTRRIFLVFLALSACSATQYCFLVYIPIFLLGCGQMRIFNGRTITAAILGLITPWWIMAAFGLVSLEQLHMPELVNIFSRLTSTTAGLLLITVGLTSLLTVGSFVMNVMKTIAYNARARAYSGAIATVSLATLAGMVVDYQTIILYIPLLNYCAAFEVAGYFSSHRGERTGLGPLIIVASYIILFLCQILF